MRGGATRGRGTSETGRLRAGGAVGGEEEGEEGKCLQYIVPIWKPGWPRVDSQCQPSSATHQKRQETHRQIVRHAGRHRQGRGELGNSRL